LLERLQEEARRVPLTDLMDSVFSETGYQRALLSEGEIGQIRFENVRELFTVAEKYKKEKGFAGLSMFLEEAALMASTDNIDSKSGLVHLMTLHSAKGLEFDTVFIAGMEEGLFPHSRAMLDPGELEEERRLCYVGITRAKKRIYLLWATTRHIFGSTRVNVASRFLDDIPEELKNEHGRSKAVSSYGRKDSSKLKFEEFKDGERIKHPTFGEGIVISAEDDLVTIAFMKAGVKKISARFRKLEKQ
jgi:DNA helicase-2/ATP-dependent DNA helicase PcrA